MTDRQTDLNHKVATLLRLLSWFKAKQINFLIINNDGLTDGRKNLDRRVAKRY